MAEVGPRLEIRGLSASYDRAQALRDVSFMAGPGELLGVIGPNGAGKSTLIRAVVGLVVPDAGEILVDGRPSGNQLRRIAFVPQQQHLDRDYPVVVREVVAMGRAPHLGRIRRPRDHDRRSVERALGLLGLESLAERPLGELSGGQRQRAFLARALAQEADLLLLDEPFTGVDAATERMLWVTLERLRDDGATILLVGHDVGGVSAHCDRLLLLARRVVALGSPRTVATPANIVRAYGGDDAAAVVDGGHA